MKPIKLKITNTRLTHLPEIIYNYADYLVSVLVEFDLKENAQTYTIASFELSISLQLYETLNKKNLKRYPAKSNSIRLEYHEAITLSKALYHHIRSSENDLTRSIAHTLYLDLEPQIPNSNQLKTIKL